MKPLPLVSLGILLLGTLGLTSAEADFACVDSNGIWSLPDGLVLGGPQDNSALPTHADWLARCGFGVEPRIVFMEEPYEEVLARWEACLVTVAREEEQRQAEAARPLVEAVSRDVTLAPLPPVEKEAQEALAPFTGNAQVVGVVGVAHDAALPQALRPAQTLLALADTPFLDPAEEAVAPAAEEAEESAASAEAVKQCGAGPDPEDVLENGNLRFEVPMLHVGSPDGSIQYASYSTKSDGSRAARINVVYWNNGEVTTAYNKLVSTTHWNYADCGSDRWAWVYDGIHTGGVNKNWVQTHQSEAHRDGWYTPCASDTRYHMRHWGRYLHDTHYGSGSFGQYSIGNVHWETNPHEDTADSQRGQDHLWPERGAFAVASSMLWNPYTSSYELYFKLA